MRRWQYYNLYSKIFSLFGWNTFAIVITIFVYNFFFSSKTDPIKSKAGIKWCFEKHDSKTEFK